MSINNQEDLSAYYTKRNNNLEESKSTVNQTLLETNQIKQALQLIENDLMNGILNKNTGKKPPVNKGVAGMGEGKCRSNKGSTSKLTRPMKNDATDRKDKAGTMKATG